MMKLSKVILLTIFIFVQVFQCFGTEGMWLPLLLGQLNETEMKNMGMKISADDIYNVNKGSLKDAIISFGGFCTGEIISDQGLILTNHHCGYDAIQNHSSVEHDYLQDGFWAFNQSQELTNPGLSATFIIRIEDITKEILANVSDDLSERDRQSAIDKNIERIKKSAARESDQDILIKPFFEGNQYFLFVTETYRDIRLVGAPPSSIGKFGSDTDNWVWPRHTGDFSMFRIYANKNNRPADYSPDNVPYRPKHFLPISLDGVAEGDFTLVFGFPGRTQEYLPACAVQQVQNILDPARISIRDRALKIMDTEMRNNQAIKIQYASKYASAANGWKKWIGEVQGLKSKKAVDKKRKYESDFQNRLNNDEALKRKYGNILNDIESIYQKMEPYAAAREYQREVFTNTEFLSIVSRLNGLVNAYEKNGEDTYQKNLKDFKTYLDGFYKEYQTKVDKQIFAALTEMYLKNVNPDFIFDETRNTLKKYKNNYTAFAEKIFQKSAIPNATKLIALLDKKPADAVAAIKKDMGFKFGKGILDAYAAKVDPKIQEFQPQINRLQRQYMQAQIDAFKDKRFFPDANSTMRVTYGNVKGYEPRDGVFYEYYTYLDGVMEKYIPGDYEFDVPKKLIELYEAKDYGNYGINGKMPLCFLGTNHTTGGNSGSPSIDAYGNLIGLNFDRVWEGTMSDINYDPSICRNIMVDARYILFIVDKFAGAKNLIDEMKLVHPKNK